MYFASLILLQTATIPLYWQFQIQNVQCSWSSENARVLNLQAQKEELVRIYEA
jgi:hypothetical protein